MLPDSRSISKGNTAAVSIMLRNQSWSLLYDGWVYQAMFIVSDQGIIWWMRHGQLA